MLDCFFYFLETIWCNNRVLYPSHEIWLRQILLAYASLILHTSVLVYLMLSKFCFNIIVFVWCLNLIVWSLVRKYWLWKFMFRLNPIISLNQMTVTFGSKIVDTSNLMMVWIWCICCQALSNKTLLEMLSRDSFLKSSHWSHNVWDHSGTQTCWVWVPLAPSTEVSGPWPQYLATIEYAY